MLLIEPRAVALEPQFSSPLPESIPVIPHVAYYSIPMMEAQGSFKRVYQTMQYHILEGCNLDITEPQISNTSYIGLEGLYVCVKKQHRRFKVNDISGQ
jgi:hypothetical protein